MSPQRIQRKWRVRMHKVGDPRICCERHGFLIQPTLDREVPFWKVRRLERAGWWRELER